MREANPGFALATALFLTSLGCQQLPESKWTALKKLKEELHFQQSPRYAAKEFDRFAEEYEKLRLRYRLAAVKNPLFRDSEELESELTRQLECGESVLSATRRAREALRRQQAEELDAVARTLESFAPTLHPSFRARLTSIRIDFSRAEELWRKEEFLQAAPLLVQTRISAEKLVQDFDELLGRLKDPHWIEQWRTWSRETIGWSRLHRRPALIVDKHRRRALLYQDGRLSHQLEVELGWNGLVRKIKAGDGATPEGTYRVLEKRGAGQTRFFRALLLDYPNRADRVRFSEAREAGRIQDAARIGGLIEVHGEGGRGADWTQGCVALNNQQMELLFDLAEVGMPVTIVGRFEP